MAGKVYRWDESKREKVKQAVQSSSTRAEAASKLGISPASLSHACETYGISAVRELVLPTSQAATFAPPVPVKEHEAPWQGYRPRRRISKVKESHPAKCKDVNPTLTIVLSDLHVPHHDVLAFSCALGIIKALKPSRVVLNGDFLDLESLSRHPKSRPDLARLAEEFYAGNLALDSIQAASGDAEIVFLEGNHEARARRYEAEYGQLDGILSVPVGLYIEPRQEYRKSADDLRSIRWVPLQLQPIALGGVSYLHGVFESIHHAYQHAWQLGPRCSTKHLISGHMHALQMASSASGHIAAACPWLGDIRAHVFGYTKGRPRPWSHGVLVVEEVMDRVTISPVSIVNGVAVFGGRLIQAKESKA
jgi:predicted phosphodiesterase